MANPFRLLKNFLGRGARLRALEEEMRAHVELARDEYVRQGLPADEAARRAHLEFGNLLAAREEATDAMAGARLDSWMQDARIAGRSLSRRPQLAISVMAILALGVGATTAIFTVVRGVLWTPLAVPAPAELHLAVDPDDRPMLLSAPAVRRLEADPAARGRTVAYSSSAGVALRRDGAPAEPVQVQFVNGGFFEALRVAPAAGRMLSPADDELGRARAVAVVSWRWWQRELGGDPAAVGRAFRLNNAEVTVVGVAPAEFTGVALGDGVDFWLPTGQHAPLRASPAAWAIWDDEPITIDQWGREDRVAWLNAMVRREPGEPGGQALVESAWRPQRDAVLALVEDPADRERFAKRGPRLVPSPQGFSSTRNSFRGVGTLLSVLVGVVLLVTAANSSTLLLLRMLGRSRELGVRMALGAGRWRLMRAALMEGLFLSAGGAAGGLLLGIWLTPVLAGWVVPEAAENIPGVDGALLGVLCALVVVLGIVLGAVPAWLSARLAPQAVLQQRGEIGGSMRIGRALVIMQLGLSVVLVSFAGVLARDVQRMLRRDLGYAREGVVSTFFSLGAAGFTASDRPAVIDRLRTAAASVPQVRGVGFAAGGMLSGRQTRSAVFFRGEGVHRPGDGNVQHEAVDENYFKVCGLTLLRGRGIEAHDRAGRGRVAVVSERLARQVFGDADPIGRRFGYDREPGNDPDFEIVGVVADAWVNGVRDEPPGVFYTSLDQTGSDPGCMAIRVDGDAEAAREALRRAIGAAEPALMFSSWLTIQERVRQRVRNDLATVRLTAGFGALATLLAIVGVVGALGYLVATRSREIAVRIALGADPARVWREIVRGAVALGAAGSGLGVVIGVGVPRLFHAALPTDVLAVALAAVIGLAAAIVGGLLPARRAARVDPLTLLRSE
ncbi:MAG TPA: ABC transporter permease [Opitutaceae bacterium]|nr:ABC transporter permease [Opitutaceae bacterium]